jgi:sucrose-6-phosphate hydrolase SacC (GH32 family)
MRTTILLIFAILSLTVAVWAEQPDIVIADFEGETYGDWTVTGEAFGKGPAHGALPHQRHVAGFEGKGLVNSYLGGDKATGTLTSPPFTIQRPYINFLIGGGSQPGKACVNLLVGGKVVLTATGMNDETLTWTTWNVSDLVGKKAQIQIVDKATGGWGHINVDQIVQGDRAKVVVEPLRHERYRPQFHFTPEKNWTNDPNGLVFYKGEYHLFFQHNPTGINWGNMTWGHAVSPDLFHWKQLANAIEPDALGTIFSGSAVVDWNNTAGFQSGDGRAIVCIYTSAGGTSPESKGQPFTQSIAYSTDCGRTWKKYEKNPVLAHIVGGNRDPKVIWHAATKQWVMALYLDKDRYALFGSPNLKEWTKLSDVPSVSSGECPDLFELPVDGDAKNMKWVFWGGNNNYLIGTFDGKTFTKEAGPLRFEYGANYYASQTYSDIPAADGRRIQIAWMAGGKYPGMPFNQQMSLPSELVLRTLPDGVRLCRRPVKELDALHGACQHRSGAVREGENLLSGISGELLDLRAEIEPGAAAEIGFTIHGKPLTYNTAKKQLTMSGKTASLEPIGGVIRLQIVVDRSSIEVFANDGLVTMSGCFISPENDKSMAIFARGGVGQLKSLSVWEVKSVWP